MFLTFFRSGRDTDESSADLGVQGKTTRKATTLSRGWSRVRMVVDIRRGFLRLKASLGNDGHPS